MKKESTFKMKGFSGFGTEESPAKAKTVTINEDGSKTVTRTRRDGTVKKVKEFKAGKKKAFKTTRTKRSGDTVTREFKKGVKGATITKRQSKKSGATIYNETPGSARYVPAGGVISQTTRKQRNQKRIKGLKTLGKVAAGAGLGVMTGAAIPGALAAAGKTALIAGGTAYAADVLGGIGRGAKRIVGNIKKNRKNPNRNRL